MAEYLSKKHLRNLRYGIDTFKKDILDKNLGLILDAFYEKTKTIEKSATTELDSDLHNIIHALMRVYPKEKTLLEIYKAIKPTIVVEPKVLEKSPNYSEKITHPIGNVIVVKSDDKTINTITPCDGCNAVTDEVKAKRNYTPRKK